jgi:hypothetical protein
MVTLRHCFEGSGANVDAIGVKQTVSTAVRVAIFGSLKMSLRPALAARSGRKLLSTAAAVKPIEWESARPYEEIPGPKPIPILGNKHLFVTRFRKWN